MALSAVRYGKHLGVCVHAPLELAYEEKAVNLAFLIDVSNSMTGERLDAVKKTLGAARDLFRADDRVTMVTFGDDATTVVDNLSLEGEGMTQFYAAIDSIKTNGYTNMSAGIERLLSLQRSGDPFDAVLLLTDGHVNLGITSTAGLRTMALGLGFGSPCPITALGYGANHNRVLLREIATRSRGAYMFVDTESMLPIAMGDMIGGLRTEVIKNATVKVPAGWNSIEQEGGGSSYCLGNVVAGRDYWAIFRFSEGDPIDADPIVLTGGSGRQTEINRVVHVPLSDCLDLREQVLRCRVAQAIVNASNKMEASQAIGDEIALLLQEFALFSADMLCRPLVLRMKAQLAEIMETVTVTPLLPPRSPPSPYLLARMASGCAYLSVQRGVSSQGVGDPIHLFSSPTQRLTSSQVQSHYEV